MDSFTENNESLCKTWRRPHHQSAAWTVAATAIVMTGMNLVAMAQTSDTPMAIAPPGHAQLSRTLNGWIYVPMVLKKKYDEVLARLETLQTDVDEGRLRAAAAQNELAELKRSLDALRNEIKAAQVVVTGPTLHEQTESFEFELGPDRLLAITANQVHLIAWDRPNVKCELKKSVLSLDDKAVDTHLQAIRIHHQRGKAEFAGQTPAEREKSEQEYLAGEGAKLTDEQRENWRKLVNQIGDSYAIYRPYLSKAVDQLTVDGLDYESNKWLLFGVKSQNGDGSVGGARQRYGTLTVYVPPCAGVVVRGAMRGLVVEGLMAPLSIAPHDSTDSNIQGEFTVRNLQGNLTVQDFPLRTVSDVTGRVSLTLTEELGFQGAGLSHRDNLRRSGAPRPLKLQIENVTDGVELRLGHINVHLQNIQGRIDVMNDFGATRLMAREPLAATAHRIVSQGGRIDVELSPAAWSSVPIIAVTSHGGYGTNIAREEFDDFHLHGGLQHDQTRRSWNGFRSVTENEGRMATFQVIGRLHEVLQNTARPPGLDLISRGGSVTVLRK